MKKNLIVGIIFVSLFLYSQGLFDNFDTKRKMLLNAAVKKYGAERAKKLVSVYDTLKKVGLPPVTLRLALSQVMHETGVFSGKQRATNYNNFSGITYSGSKEQLATGAKKSPVALPAAEQPAAAKADKTKTIYYAAYESPVNWAKDYIRIISRGTKPIHAATPEDFATRLKKNKYYADAVEVYTRNLTFFNNFLSKLGV